MSQDFKIKVGNIGSLTGVWNSNAPPALGCTYAQWKTSLLAGARVYTNAGVGVFQSQSFTGQIVLSGGNAWDGTYANINELPINGIVPYGISLRGEYFRPGFAPAPGNTFAIDWLSGPLTSVNIGSGGFYDTLIALPTAQYPNVGFPTLFLLCTDRIDTIFTLTAGEIGILQDFYIIGSYLIVDWSWQIANGVDLANDIKGFGTEKRFEISSGGGVNGDISNIYSTATPTKTGPDLKGTFGTGSGSGVSSITFVWIDAILGTQSVTVLAADFDDWTSIFISFLLPDTIPDDGTTITVIVNSDNFPAIPIPFGTGTQFSGSVPLGRIKILTTEASGIYRIITDKTDDTIYINSPTSDDTAELAIPYPHIKTGFIGG